MANEDFTAGEIARRVAYTQGAEEVLQISRQIYQWTNANLLTLAGVKHVGRGKARRYPEQTVYWTALLMWLATQGAGVGYMASILGALGPLGERSPVVNKAVKDAMEGQRRVLCLFEDYDADRAMAATKNSAAGLPYWRSRYMIDAKRSRIPADWTGGHWLDLTKIFARVRL